MTIKRMRFDILTDTGGDWTDTGGPIAGAILQTQYVAADAADALDTGADLHIRLVTKQGDTGSDVVVAVDRNALGASFTRVYKRDTYDTGGGALGIYELPIGAGEPLRVIVNQSAGVTGAKQGTIYIWTGE